MENKIVFKCPTCQKELKFPEKYKGRTGMCPFCSAMFVINPPEDISKQQTVPLPKPDASEEQPQPKQEPQTKTEPLDPWAYEHPPTSTNVPDAGKNKPQEKKSDDDFDFHVTDYSKKT